MARERRPKQLRQGRGGNRPGRFGPLCLESCHPSSKRVYGDAKRGPTGHPDLLRILEAESSGLTRHSLSAAFATSDSGHACTCAFLDDSAKPIKRMPTNHFVLARRVILVSSDCTPSLNANPGHIAVPLFTYNVIAPTWYRPETKPPLARAIKRSRPRTMPP